MIKECAASSKENPDFFRRPISLIHNNYWSVEFDSLIEDIMQHSGFNLLHEDSLKGIEIFKFRFGEQGRRSPSPTP
jgi:hypothetical protein